MIKIDLITGFLGSGKTTFIRKYASYLLEQGMNIGILENDFGAVNVDSMLLQDILGEHCTLESVAGGCDADCHRRRFKTKLIAMGMCGYDRILVEPSGIFDMDEFFDVLHEEPLDRWYEPGSVITIVDATLELNLSPASGYILASQVAQAGCLLYSHVQEVSADRLTAVAAYISEQLTQLHCPRDLATITLQKDWSALEPADFQRILSAGYHPADYPKRWLDQQETYESLYFMNRSFTPDTLQDICTKLLKDPACGKVFRIKGFQQLPDQRWISINATHQGIRIEPIPNGQAILIVIGEGLCQDAIEAYFSSSISVPTGSKGSRINHNMLQPLPDHSPW